MTSIGNETPGSDRLVFIDSLRGLAILGILVMNIQAFGRVEDAYSLPNIHEPLSTLDRLLHGIGYFLAEQVFVGLLSCLFGIGIWLAAQRAQMAGHDPVVQQRRRSIGLLLIGLIHAYLIWTGDILVPYALAAWILAPSVHWSRRRQWQIGLAFLAVIPALSLLEIVLIPADVRSAVYAADPNAFTLEIDALRGAWWQNQSWRFSRTLEMHLVGIPFGTFWFVGGWMLLGMALFRLGFAAGQWPRAAYWRCLLLSVLAGLAFKATSYSYQSFHQFDPETLVLGRGVLSYLGAACLTLSTICLAILCWQRWPTFLLGRGLAAIGRLALSNYLLQSLIATSLFYGFGLGWFERLSFGQLFLVTIGIWLVNAAFTALWLRYFRLGPMEWLWRWLSRRQAPAIRR
ncbi:DUF418 domain-containing protein [Saccharospirillum mangrovi]|uniref:DUF418 domain-containing protein n=1 Tax=Saccharospirillum mangrovi TaxID=2161747 RepID=UPI000D394FE1|nr:DUF418 domain-containing protein [Saccharospirillum mangrovi]